ncbi:MAG TPA: ATP-binding cassette domain-containing protein [Planctomycetota bacterium]|nr:ATP-binding cassette domain-containing protein [Planctomycetota bacterium]
MNVIGATHVRKTFRRPTKEVVTALDDVSLECPASRITALVGPDGAGKTTFLRLAAGLLRADGGMVTVLGKDAAVAPREVQARVAYMPQRFGLYEDLTVRENLDLYSSLHGVSDAGKKERYPRLMDMTALGPFMDRLAGHLSGGMKQKLGLACTLVRAPELLLLDEPTVGVDPVSRRELWVIIRQLAADGVTVLMSTSYLDEAELCGHVVVLHEGRVLASGAPAELTEAARGLVFEVEPRPGCAPRELQARLIDDARVLDALPEGGRVRLLTAELASVGGVASARPVTPRFADAFMVLVRRSKPSRPLARRTDVNDSPAVHARGRPTFVRVRELVRSFGEFVAVDHVSFEVKQGEVFGLLGPNGAGKTTTFRMLCGLLAPTSGTLEVAGIDLHRGRASARQKIGYVAQKFSLYGLLSVRENLEFFGSAYGLRGSDLRRRVEAALRRYELDRFATLASEHLPGGYKRRLAMASALLHGPEILFLDEPTSGADPLSRREFWREVTSLSARGVTVIVTTHFMEEAEYCDHLVVMDSGRVLAHGAPAEVRELGCPVPGRELTMEDAFVSIVERSRAAARVGAA